VSRLAWATWARDATPSDCYTPGDVVMVWAREDTRDAHVMCVLAHDTDAQLLTTAEYGQPGGRVRDHVLSPPRKASGGWVVGLRPIQRVLRLEPVILAAANMGALVAVDGPRLLASWKETETITS
jgi:hypothetical protein